VTATSSLGPEAAQHADAIAAEGPRLGRRWRLPQGWRERTDWISVDTTVGQVLRGVRWAAILCFFGGLIYTWHGDGLPFDREGLLLWIAIGLGCFCIGRHPVWMLWVAVDFIPLTLVLVAYDYLRGIADTVGMPTWWTPQADVDKFLFFGHQPTIWLQEHLKHGPRYWGVQWYDLAVCITYYSFFFLPYITAGVLWLRSRRDFYRWSGRFVSLSLFGFTLFTLFPAAPPWAAALCTPQQVADHPSSPACMNEKAHAVAGNLLGPYTSHLPSAHQYVERISGDSFYKLHLGVAHGIWTKGFSLVDLVAAVPSLHVGGTVLFCLFMWRRLSKGWRPLLIGYPLAMQFSLTYAGEHYVADGIAGAVCAFFIHWLAGRIERWWQRRRGDEPASRPDTLEKPPHLTLETQCPPTDPLPATTP
jgi:PAP2 superfamily